MKGASGGYDNRNRLVSKTTSVTGPLAPAHRIIRHQNFLNS
jgi:hypothetical protein